MEIIIDDVFGKLTFSYAWKKEVNQVMFGVTKKVELIVEGNDENETIRNEQRISYHEFQTRNSEIVKTTEEAIFEYYKRICDDCKNPIVEISDMASQVELTGVIFPMVIYEGDISVGFLFECAWDPEHGLGVKIVNGKIEVSTQDLLA